MVSLGCVGSWTVTIAGRGWKHRLPAWKKTSSALFTRAAKKTVRNDSVRSCHLTVPLWSFADKPGQSAEPFPLIPRLIFRRSAELCPRVRRFDIRQPENPFWGEELTWFATNKCRYPSDGMAGSVRWLRRWKRQQRARASGGALLCHVRPHGMRCWHPCRSLLEVITPPGCAIRSAFLTLPPFIRRQSAIAAGCGVRYRATLPLRA